MNKLLLLSLCALCSFSGEARASDGSGGHQFYELVFGKPKQRLTARNNKEKHDIRMETCEDYGGILGEINGFFCHMEKDMGITGPGSVTKTFGPTKIHAEIIANAITINSVDYATQAKVWICDTTASACNLPSQYARTFFVAFTNDKASGINRGYAISDPGKLHGNTGNGSELVYDIGSGTTTQTISHKMVFNNNGQILNMRVQALKTATSFKLNVSGYNSTGAGGFRFAMSGTPPSPTGGTANVYNMYYEFAGGTGSNGAFAIDAAALGTPSTASGYCVAANESKVDTEMTSATGACSSLAFAPFDYYSQTASGTPSAQSLSATTILGSWQGMSASPSSL